MKPHELQPAPGARTARTRAGRGEASGKGKTAGRGTKGTRARKQVRPFFEGGQMPLTRRIPKLKGFTPPHRTVYGAVNLAALARVEGSEIGPDEMRAAGLLHKRHSHVKVLAAGELERAVSVRAHAFSDAARSKIEAAGGRAQVIPTSPPRKGVAR